MPRVAQQDRQILALAIPALAALIAEPAFLLADSAIVGHLGELPLAGLGIASAVLGTVVGLAVFLAYGTTAGVARRLGAGDLRAAMALGVDGLWLAVGLGVLAWVVTALAAPWLVSALGASEQVAPYAVTYLRWSLPGIPAMLLVLAATGVVRGLQDTRTPLVVTVSGAVLNVGLNYVLVYPAGMGIAGSGLGTSLAQFAMAVAMTTVVVRAARRHGASLRPDATGIRAAAVTGLPLVVRSVAMRAVLLLLAAAAAVQGDTQLAGHQVVFTIWLFTSFVLDAIAIAGQALTGTFLGAGDIDGTRSATRRMVIWGVGFGTVVGLVMLVTSPWLGRLFSPDRAVQDVIAAVLLVAAFSMPISGYVFVLDGVLIGAGDGRYLGIASIVNAVVFVPLVGVVLAVAPRGTTGLVWLWCAFIFGWMGARTVTLGLRERSGRWLVTGQ